MSVEIDFDKPLQNVFGQEETDGDGHPVRLGFVCCLALGRTWQGDKRDDAQKDADWKLALKIGKSGPESSGPEPRFGLLKLENKQATHLAEVARAVYPGPSYGSQIALLLEGPAGEQSQAEA